MKSENVIIIGGGPAGLAAAIYTARAGLNPLLFAGSPPGGQLTLTTDVENYPGFESILGPELIEKMRAHAKKFGVRIVDENVIKIDFSDTSHKTYTTNESYGSHAVIIATGAKALWLGLESEQRLRGKGVSACATCDGFFFRDKTVAVVGGGDTAMEEALTLTKFASKVYIVHRRDSFRASKIMQERVFEHPKIEAIWNTIVEEIVGETKVTGIRIKKIAPMKQSNNGTMLEVDGVFIAIGHKPDTDIFKGQVEIDEKGYIITTERRAYELFKSETNPNDSNDLGNSSLEHSNLFRVSNFDIRNYRSSTSVPGVFAAGDCVDYQYRQAATAAGMGVAAALEVEKWLISNS